MTKLQYKKTKKIVIYNLIIIFILLIALISSIFYVKNIKQKTKFPQIEVIDYDLIDKTVDLDIHTEDKVFSKTVKLSEQKGPLPNTKLYEGTYIGKGTIKTETGDLWVLNKEEPYFKDNKWTFNIKDKVLMLIDTRGTAASTDDVVVMVRNK